ncbi:methyl-CpG-binding domain-containing protein 11-like [Tripterygium wilfordii]|uniref:Methyl-CpG-binding domain-containing protein 11-like n=2 Tax=Tripterygium wilfordii TaxID=458696 RepID=A0A7J7DF09_TRIWF|nr:methyl-CpG-binding domain-containing protein 11-like [Tripterygium wilfordii]
MASSGNDVASNNNNLSAPTAWTKKINPKKIGLSKRDEVVFLSPAGDEIKSKRQLELYLKAHPGGPSISEFDWSAGDGPRRSTRLSEKSRGTQTPVSEPSRKRQKKSDSMKGEKEEGDGVDDDGDGEDEISELKEDEATGVDAKASENVEMIDLEDAGDKDKGEAYIEEQEVLIAGSSDMVSMPETQEEVLIDPQNLENQKAASDAAVDEQEDMVIISQIAVKLAEYKEDSASRMAEAEASSKLEAEEVDDKIAADIKIEEYVDALQPAPELKKDCENAAKPAETESPSKLETEEVDDKITADIKIEESVNALQPAPELKKDCENATKPEETEAPSKLETEGADNDITLEAQVRSESRVELGLEENKVKAEKQPSEKEASCVAADAKVEMEFKAADAEQANSHDKEVST